MEGPLSVWTSFISGWHLCWVVLDDRNGILYRFKSHQQRRQRRGLLAKFAGINLLGAIVTKDPKEPNGFSVVSEGREYRFQAPSEEERDTWVMELEEAVLRQMVSRRAYHIWDRRYIGPTLALVNAKLQDAGLLYEELACSLHEIDMRWSTEEAGQRARWPGVIRDLLTFLTTARATMALLENLKEMILPGLLAQLDTMQPRKKTATMLSLLRTQAAGLAVDPLSALIRRNPEMTSEGSALLQPALRGSRSRLHHPLSDMAHADHVEFMSKLDTLGHRSPSTLERTATRSLPAIRSPGSGQQHTNAENSTLMSDSDSAASSTARYLTAHSSVDASGEDVRPVTLESPGCIWEEAAGPAARDLAELCVSLPFGEHLLDLDYPLSLLQHRSCLQALADLFACPELFVEIGSSTRASERMLRALRWYLAGVYYVKRGDDVTKPLEPALGGDAPLLVVPALRPGRGRPAVHCRTGTCLYAECSSNGIRALAQIQPEAFSVGSYIQVRLHGNVSVYVGQYSEEYVFELPPGCVRDLASKPWFEFCGVVNVSCRETGFYAKMKFISKAPVPDSQRHNVQVDVYNPVLNRPFVRLHGRWVDSVTASWASGETKEILHSKLLKQARREPAVIIEDNHKCSTVLVAI
ncbi:hypothetical protein MRX96_007827 [Rhipicephalus microplus]